MSLLLRCCMKTSAKHGADVDSSASANESLEVYLASVVSLLPKQSQIEKRSPFDDLTDAELDQLEEYIAGMRLKRSPSLSLWRTTKRLLSNRARVEEKDATQPISTRRNSQLQKK